MKLFGFDISWSKSKPEPQAQGIPTIDVNDLPNASTSALNSYEPYGDWSDRDWTGNKFLGGFGATKIFTKDYWTLRARSAQLFTENLYARGMIRRLVTNEINTGLSLEATPEETVLGLPEDSLTDWSDDVERRFELWATNALVCDYLKENNFAQIQTTIRTEALIEGDVLVVLRVDRRTKMPAVEVIGGSSIQTPFGEDAERIPESHTVTYGVERDARGRKVAFWVKQTDLSYKRLAAYGSRSGRRIAWLVYGTDKRMNEVRGEPMLSIILQSLKEIDRYRDSKQRAAVIAATVAMFVQKTEDKPSTLPLTGGAVKKNSTTVTDSDGRQRKFSVADQTPGVIMEELQTGETPHAFSSNAATEGFAVFEEALLRSIAWANEIPPEIMLLSFSSNYSASQAAINEFKMYLNKTRSSIGWILCRPIYIEWLVVEVLLKKIPADGLLAAWRNPEEFETFGAWIASDWSGAIKPSTDMLKTANAYEKMLKLNAITYDRATREMTGQKFSRVVRANKRANQLIADSLEPLAEFRKKFGDAIANDLIGTQNEVGAINTGEIVAEVLNEIEDQGLELIPAPTGTDR